MKPDDIEQWAWDEASKVAEYINDTTVLHSLVMNAAARAILQARSQAFEECAKIVEDCNMWDGRREIAQAILQNVGEK